MIVSQGKGTLINANIPAKGRENKGEREQIKTLCKLRRIIIYTYVE
jgi:hypothetical protein